MMVTTKYRKPTHMTGEAIRVTVFDKCKTTKIFSWQYDVSDMRKYAVEQMTGKEPRFIGEFENGTVVWEV